MLAFVDRSRVHQSRSHCRVEPRRTIQMMLGFFWLPTALTMSMKHGSDCLPNEADERAMSSAKPF